MTTTPDRRPATALIWCARVGALASALAVTAIGLHLLREAGLRFRWEVDREGTFRREPAARGPEPTPRPSPGGSDGSAAIAGGGARAPAGRPAGPGPPARIDFERYPDGTPVCAPCPVSDEFAEAGVRFAFRSSSRRASRPHIVEVGEFSAPGETVGHAVAPAYRGEKGLEVGVVAMEFPRRPVRVRFELTGPDLVPRFRITAWTADGRIESSEIPRTAVRRFVAVGGGRFRRELVTVESAAGIRRIELDGRGPPGHVLLVDDLVLEPRGPAHVESAGGRSSSR